jgi:PAS domain S-box-containing protein
MKTEMDQLKEEFRIATEAFNKQIIMLKESAEQLEIERAVFGFLAESSTDGVWDWNMESDYEYMSPRFWEIFGYLPEEKEHKPSAWMNMINQEDLKATLINLDKHVSSNGSTPYDQVVRYTHKNGSIVTVRCRGRVVKWSNDGKPIRMVGTHTDITKSINK